MKRLVVPLILVAALLIVAMLFNPPIDMSARIGWTPTVHIYMPMVKKYPTPTPTLTPTPTRTPTPIPCQVWEMGWSKREGWVDIIFLVEGSDMVVSFYIHYSNGAQTTTKYVGNRTLTVGERRYSYNDGLSIAWQPFQVEIVAADCVETGQGD